MDWFTSPWLNAPAATPDRPHNTTPEARSSKPGAPEAKKLRTRK